MISFLLADRRCWLVGLVAVLAAVVGFYAIPDPLAMRVVSKAGYWFVLAAFLFWIRALWLTFRDDITAWGGRRWDWASLGIVVVGSLVLLAHETSGFKILMDEIMLLGTSMSMHLDKTAVTPLRGHDIQGAFVILEGVVDKRPLFFPFLLSLLHDVFGYRPGNAFALNAVLTVVFLGLVFLAGRMLAGRVAGWLGVMLFAGLPLLGHNATGGGFELLNLTMILGTLLLGAQWVQKRDAASLQAFCFGGLLLAQVRYESVLFLLPVAALVLWVWIQERRVILPWPLILAPLLMIHYPLQHRIFDIRASAWEMASKPGFESPFSLSYFPEGVLRAMRFFFAGPADQPNSIVLSILGWLAVPFFTLWAAKQIRTWDRVTPMVAAMVVFSVGLMLHFGLMMCYAWGFDEVVTRRLSLPAHLLLVLALLSILPQFKHPAVLRTLLGAAVVGLLARSVPSMAAHAYSQEYLPALETAWRREFMAKQPRADYLVMDNDSTLWVTHKVSATPTAGAMKRQKDIAFFMRNRGVSDVFVFQRFNVDAETGALTLREGDDPGPAFVLEPVVEERLQFLTLSRISRVKEIREGEQITSTPTPVRSEPKRSRAEIEEARRLFLERYMKQLP